MIIPIKCFTCGKVIADKWEYYERRVKEMEQQTGGAKKTAVKKNEDMKQAVSEQGESFKSFDKKYTGKILDELGLERLCCRRMMLGHVDLIEII